jgi:hypothetical protein
MSHDPVIFETTVTPPVAFPTTVQTGVQGRKGDKGADASVTQENIANALGYSPVSPSRAIAFSIAL